MEIAVAAGIVVLHCCVAGGDDDCEEALFGGVGALAHDGGGYHGDDSHFVHGDQERTMRNRPQMFDLD